MSAPKIIYTAEEAQALWQRGFDAGRAAVPPEGLDVCPVCDRVIVNDAHGGPKPSAGDHDPAPHVARTYGTT